MNYIEEKYICEYIFDKLNKLKNKNIIIEDARYHHNTNYNDVSSILQYGILSMQSISDLKIKNYSDEILKIMDDTNSHINGKNGISLSVVGLNDLYRDEFEYDSSNPDKIDLLITSEIKASRNSTHYGNEFISYNDITSNMIKSIDIRLLKYIESSKNVSEIIKKYNCLKEIAISLKKYELDIPIREMSSGNMSLDIDKLIEEPVLKIK